MRFPVLALLGLLASTAMATPDQMEAFRSALHLRESSSLYKSQCMSCHTNPPEHNAFGKDLKAAMKANGKDLVTLQIIQSLGAKDSDGDGWSNEEELKQNFLPGDPNSHPAGMPPKQTGHEKMMGANMDEATGKKKSLVDQFVPKHSFHPLMVHFPIALFLFGAGLEFFGWRKKLEAVRQAGWLAVLFGTLSTLFAVPTGLMVFLRSGFEWSGTALIHFILAISATLVMTLTVVWRRKAAHESYSYFALLLLAAVLVGAAGHFGGQLVYGG